MTRLALLCTGQALTLLWVLSATRPILSAALGAPAALVAASLGTLVTTTVAALAVGAAGWLLLGTLHDTVWAIVGRDARAIAPNWVRRIISQAVGTALMVGTLAGPAGAAVQPSSIQTVAAADAGLRPIPSVTPGAASSTAGASPIFGAGLSSDFSDDRPADHGSVGPAMTPQVSPIGDGMSLAGGTTTTWAALAAPASTAPVLPPALQVAPSDGETAPQPPESMSTPGPTPPPDPATVTTRPPPPAPDAPTPADPAVDDPAALGTSGDDPQSVHTVARGDNLWLIARGQVMRGGLTAPTDRQVHAYWVRLLAANRDGLTSGDIDLIYPGEAVRLPTLDEAPADAGADGDAGASADADADAADADAGGDPGPVAGVGR